MAPPLTVRNLTSAAIILKSLERFEDPNTRQSKATAFPSALKNAQTVAPSAPELGQHVQTFKRQEVNITLSPFESYTLRPPVPDTPSAPGQSSTPSTTNTTTLRITIENETGHRFRIDINPTYTQKASRIFTPLTTNPSTSYIALYHPTTPTAHLTIYAQHSPTYYAEWMRAIPDTLPLSALSIPGTHNSHTHYRALPSVRCQTADIATQLQNGIRFLDIRVQPASASDVSKRDLYLVHGAFPISLTGTKYLAPVLETCYAFLEAHPSETVLVSLKREGIGGATDEHLGAVLERHYFGVRGERWYTGVGIPYLGDVRGRLVLVRRFEVGEARGSGSGSGSGLEDVEGVEGEEGDEGARGVEVGLDATAWPNNSTHAVHGHFCVQDYCEIMHPSAIQDKLQHCNAHLVRAATCTHFIPGLNTDTTNPIPPLPLHLNFLSGSNFFRTGTWPEKIAKVVNRGVEEWICTGHHLALPVGDPQEPGRSSLGVDEDGDDAGDGVAGIAEDGVRRVKEGDGGSGVVVMDMVGEGGDWDLVRLVVGLNMGVLNKVRAGE